MTSFQVVNNGEVKLGYSWHFANDQQGGKMNRSIDEVRSPPITPFTASNRFSAFPHFFNRFESDFFEVFNF